MTNGTRSFGTLHYLIAVFCFFVNFVFFLTFSRFWALHSMIIMCCLCTLHRNHPDHIAALAAEAQRWELHEAGPNAQALETMRRFVPPGIWHSNLKALFRGGGDANDGSDGGSKEGGLLPEALARRIWAKKALWLVYTVYALEREHDFFFEVTRHSPK